MHKLLSILLLSILPILANAQIDSEKIHSYASRFKLWLDSTDVSGCNLQYVKPYEKPWTIRLSIQQYGTGFRSYVPDGSYAHFKTSAKQNLQFQLAYRGYGLSYSHELSNAKQREFTLSKRGAVYGLEFRRMRNHTLHGHVQSDESQNIKYPYEYQANEGSLYERAVILNGYFVFNWRTFSYPAAITGTVRQMKSCGSPILGLSYYHSSFNSNSDTLTHYWDGIRKLKVSQFSVGAGYAYNYVFGHNSCFLLHASAIPMLSFYRLNRLSAILRSSFHYSWRDSIIGYRIVYTRTEVLSSRPRVNLTGNDWLGQFYIGYRF